MHINRFLVLACSASLAAMVASACGDDGGNNTTSTTTSSGGSSSGGSGPGGSSSSSGASGGGGPECPAPAPAHEGMTGVAMESITAMVIDQDGNAAEGVNCTICGTNICSEVVASTSSGAVSITAPTTAMDYPRFNLGHTGGGYAKLTATVPATTHDFGTVRVIRLDPFSQGAAFTPGGDVTHNGVTLALTADTVVEFELDFADPASQFFVAQSLDITGFASSEFPSIPDTLGLEQLVATSPFGTHICPGATLTFPNDMAYAAGSEVEIYLNGNLTFAHYAPYGGWELISEGTVSADGNTIETKAGMEIEMLGVFGVKPK